MPWLYVDDDGRIKKVAKEDLEVDKILKENERLRKENKRLNDRMETWYQRASLNQELRIRGEKILEKFERWWRLPDVQRTIKNIEDAMADTVELLSRKEREMGGVVRINTPEKEEYVKASIERIKDFVKDMGAGEIPALAYTAILVELKTMFDVGHSKSKGKEERFVPVYDMYKCKSCGHSFLTSDAKTAERCAFCESTNLDRHKNYAEGQKIQDR